MFVGHPHNYISGQIAMKFEVRQADSIKGVMAQFGGANQSFDDISFNVYSDANGLPGAQVSNVSLPLLARRLHSKSANGTETFKGIDVPVLYEFARPIQLPVGTYWISIDQRGETGLELAATGESMGMRTMLVQAELDNNATISALRAPMGNRGMQLLLDRRLKVPLDHELYGRVYENNNIYAYKNGLNSGNLWQPFMPTIGQVAYPHLNHVGSLSPLNRNSYQTFTRGTWAPIMAPYFGVRTVIASDATQLCPDDIIGGDDDGGLAINIVSFSGYGKRDGIQLA